MAVLATPCGLRGVGHCSSIHCQTEASPDCDVVIVGGAIGRNPADDSARSLAQRTTYVSYYRILKMSRC